MFFKAIKDIIVIVISFSFKKVNNKNNKLFFNLVTEIYIIYSTLLNIVSIVSFYSIDLNITKLFLKNYFNLLVRLKKLIIKFLSSLLKF